jgi:hypothetical protein
VAQSVLAEAAAMWVLDARGICFWRQHGSLLEFRFLEAGEVIDHS